MAESGGSPEKGYRVSDGVAVIEATERAIVGAGAVASAAEAEGLALSGHRAARLLSGTVPTAVPAAAWVLHKSGAPGWFGAFTLSAVDGQEAADHCLIAQLAAAMSGQAGQCVVGTELSERPWLWQPLTAQAIDKALAGATAGNDAIASVLSSAFARVSEATGRRHSPIAGYRLDDAEIVLLAHGSEREHGVRIVDALRRQGVAAGLLGVVQLRPLPHADITAVLSGKKRVLLLSESAELADGQALERVAAELSAVQQALGLEQRTDTDPAAKSLVVGVAPAGPRAHELLHAAAERLGGLAPLAVWNAGSPRVAALGLGSRVPLTSGAPLDLAFLAHPSLLDGRLGLRENAAVVVAAEAAAPEDVWHMLSPGQRALVGDKKLSLFWFDPRSSLSSPSASWDSLVAVVLEGLSPLLSRLGLSWRSVGKARLVRIDPRAADARRPSEVSFAPPRELPLLPKPDKSARPEWQSALRRFHATGEGAAGAAALLPLAPAAATSLVRTEASSYPLLVVDGEPTTISPLEDVIRSALGALEDAPTIVPDHVRRLVNVFTQVVDGAAVLGDVIDTAFAEFEAQLSLSEKALKALRRDLRELRPALPAEARILTLGDRAHVEMYAAVVLPARRRLRAELIADARRLRQHLLDMLAVDASHSADAHSPEQVQKSLGEMDFLDTAALTRALGKRPGPKRMPEDRRRRIQKSVDDMARFLATADDTPELLMVSPRAFDLSVSGAKVVVHDDPLGVAAGLFEGLAQQVTAALVAVRVARLEVEARYNAELHDPVLAELDWRRLDAEELLLIPPVLAVETAENVWHSSQRSLSEILTSGRPIHVIVEEDFGVGSARNPAGLGYLLVAHHEAFVAQTSLARPAHFTECLRSMAKASRPAVTVVAPSPGDGPMPAWLRLAAAHEGRVLPCFRFDPEAGLSFAESFDIEANVAPEQTWPLHTIDAMDEKGERQSIEESFTFAHAAALELEYRKQFWLIPTEAWNDEQIPLAEYVDTLLHAETPKVPFVWITDEQGNLARAIVTRDLTLQSHERMRLWRTFAELGGVRNAHAERAAEAARAAAQAEGAAEREELEAAHGAEVERVRNETATEALERLAQALMNPGALSLAQGAAAAPAPRPAPTAAEPEPAAEAAAPEPAAPPVEEEEESVSFSDPFIDTPLCTTCNECTNLNPQMFKYNADKQAFLADAKAGTFLQLVTAAEKCPASCIHPGEPRKDDSTVTEELVARAQRFN
ncbi:MAG: ferredoxin [Myxococcales bacterium]|nr:ferredoxin [Myxococcales bacterium]MCB9580370.1 ferredoxin [Polyangiaceae bacterium]